MLHCVIAVSCSMQGSLVINYGGPTDGVGEFCVKRSTVIAFSCWLVFLTWNIRVVTRHLRGIWPFI